MALADSLSKAIGNVMNALGGDVTFKVVSTGAYDPATGTAAETVSDIETKGVLQNVTAREVNGQITQNDKILTVSAEDFPNPPGADDRVLIGSTNYQIIEVRTNEQDNTAITYEIVLRG